MDSKEICLKVVKGKSEILSPFKDHMKQKPPPVLPKPRSHTPIKPSPLALSSSDSKVKENNPIPAPRDISKVFSDSEQLISSPQLTDLIISDQSTNSSATLKNSNKVSVTSNSSSLLFLKPAIQPGQHTKRVPPVLPTRNPSTMLSSTDAPLNALTNTRRIGKKLVIHLTKGPLGLGFSVTSRDNQTDGNCPIYIRNILPKGAAVQDGQLRPGDRLLQVRQPFFKTKSHSIQVKYTIHLAALGCFFFTNVFQHYNHFICFSSPVLSGPNLEGTNGFNSNIHKN